MTAATVVLRAGPRAGESPGGVSPFARWGLASRLARREVRRRPGRTVLVMLLVALPVFSMAVLSVVYRTTRDPAAERYARLHGASDVAVDGVVGTRTADSPDTPTTASLLAVLPAGSRLLEIRTLYWAPVKAVGSTSSVRVRFTDLPMTDPLTAGMAEVTSGRAPTAAGEVLLSGSVASRLGVGVGDDLVLTSPAGTFRVVGIGRLADGYREPLMVVHPSAFDGVRADTVTRAWIGDVPGGASPGVLRALEAQAHTAVSTPVDGAGTYSPEGTAPRTDQLAWGWVAGALALTVMGIIISAAFATSARRQLVTLGQLSANGADRRLLRRTLVLQGAWSGVLGSAVGLAGAGVALFAGRGVIEDAIVRHSMGPYVVSGFDMAVIFATGALAAAVAAFVPARTITRVPVLSALGGRRPLGTVPRRLVPTGLTMFGAGVVLLVVVAAATRTSTSDGNLYAAVAVVGGLGILFGMCCLTPATVAVLGPVAERLGGVGRLAARSLARSRTRSAAVVTAVAAAGALSIAGATLVSATWHAGDDPWIPKNLVWVEGWTFSDDTGSFDESASIVDEPAPELYPVSSAVRDSFSAALPGATVIPLRYAVYDPTPFEIDPNGGGYNPNRLLVVDPAVSDFLGLGAADRRALEDGKLLTTDGPWPPGVDQPTTVTLRLPGGDVEVELATSQASPQSRALVGTFLIGPATAERLGLGVGESGMLFVAAHDLTHRQREAVADLADAARSDQGNPFVAAPVSASPTERYYSVNYWNTGGWSPSRAFVNALIVAVALLFTLGVVAVGLALSAAESRDERDVLLAVGARPRSMRRLSAAKATLLAGLGGALAVPTGFVPVAVVLAKLNHPTDHLRFPWAVAGGIVFVVPVIVGLVALFGSTVGQRLRPVHMSTLATD